MTAVAAISAPDRLSTISLTILLTTPALAANSLSQIQAHQGFSPSSTNHGESPTSQIKADAGRSRLASAGARRITKIEGGAP